MMPTGIIRGVDDLGRIMIPKEVRRELTIEEGEPMEIYIDRKNGSVIFKKYEPNEEQQPSVRATIEKAIEDWNRELREISTLLGCCELLAGLAEEATELAQAALKLRRSIDGRNRTLVTAKEASEKLNEEFADVILCAAALGLDEISVERFIRAKASRWSERLLEKEG